MNREAKKHLKKVFSEMDQLDLCIAANVYLWHSSDPQAKETYQLIQKEMRKRIKGSKD